MTAEEYRQEADELDIELDGVLDGALHEVRRLAGGAPPSEFVRAWAVGHALRTSRVFALPALANEEQKLLWRALAQKVRVGARSQNNAVEPEWSRLRPRSAHEPRREGKSLDYFAMCLWLAEQDVEAANLTFGGSVHNVWQMFERPTLRPLVVREALCAWLQGLSMSRRQQVVKKENFRAMMKSLRARWPDRGPGSAKRPVHYKPGDLLLEMRRVLESFAKGDEQQSGAEGHGNGTLQTVNPG
jgi:hypothetical protein